MTITELVSKRAQGLNEQVPKTSGADVLSSRKKNSKKNLRGGGGGIPPLYVRGLIKTSKTHYETEICENAMKITWKYHEHHFMANESWEIIFHHLICGH